MVFIAVCHSLRHGTERRIVNSLEKISNFCKFSSSGLFMSPSVLCQFITQTPFIMINALVAFWTLFTPCRKLSFKFIKTDHIDIHIFFLFFFLFSSIINDKNYFYYTMEWRCLHECHKTLQMKEVTAVKSLYVKICIWIDNCVCRIER